MTEKTSITNDIVEDVSEAEKTQQHVKEDEKLSWIASVRQAPVAVGWCFYMLFTCIMWGYDGLAGAIVLSTPRWRQDYGYLFEGQYVVSADWQLAFTGASLVGLVLGGLLTGIFSRKVGNTACIGFGYIITVGGVFAQWYSPGDMPLFFAGKLLTGVPLGQQPRTYMSPFPPLLTTYSDCLCSIFLTISPTYCSDVAPPALRGAMIAAVNFSIVAGQLIAYGVQREVQGIDGPNAYRIMYAVQWGFAGVGLVFLPFLPDSPFRLLGRGKDEAARKSIAKLYGTQAVDVKFAEIQALLRDEANAAKESGSYRDCFNSQNRLRTLIALSVFFFQASSGVSWVVGYMGYFMQLSGMQGLEVFDATVGIAGLMAIGSMSSWYLIEKMGRRWLILSGLITCTISLFLIGILSNFLSVSTSIVKAQVGFMAIWAFAYQASIGSAGYTMMAEIPTSSLRGVTQSMATIVNGLSNCIWSFSLPYIINPDQANLGGKVAFIFGALLIFADIFVFFYYPEVKGRSFEEIDALFARGVKPRHFAKTRLQ